jgi:dipeptidyl aminopeptidase/acylaminoacyl peptidase
MLNHDRKLLLAPLCAALFCAVGAAQEATFTLEQIMGVPFPTELTAAPKAGKVAWIFYAQGKRNVWMAEAPEYRPRQITTYAEDDGQDLGELSWTADAQAIVYTRGGDLENDREYPNPRSFPQGVEQDVWSVSLSGGQPRRLGEGHAPAAAPQGDRVAFIFKDQVWLAKADGSEKAAQLIHARGKCGSLRWSPDASMLAFVSQREDHSLIGVYTFADKTLRYIDPSVDRDSNPIWSPDGKEIAFLRIPASAREFIFGPRRQGPPWSIRIADATTGAGREVWKAEEGKGSVFHGVVANNQLFWGTGDRLIFPWERDGWTHLYSVAASGGTARLLTPGDFEVEFVSLSPDGRELLFNSNQNDIDRRHIWREPVDGDRPMAVTSGAGLEWSPVMTGDGKNLFLLRSDARLPARPAMLTASGEIRDVAPAAIPSDFPNQKLVAPEPVVFSAADGLRIHAQLFLPPSNGPGPSYAGEKGTRHPAVVFFHGGSRRQMLLGWHYMGYYSNAYALNQYLASRGYIVLSVNYRSGIGYGLDFREALNYGATGASEFNDVQGAGLYLRSRADVDPKRIGLWGGSYGGYLTALGLARASELFAAGVDLHGVHDWNLEIPNWVPSYNPQRQPEEARVAFESSPLASVKTWRSPVLLVQGDDDRNVPFNEMVQLVVALRKQGVEFQQLVFPDEIHDFLMHSTWVRAYHVAAEFFDRKLLPAK